MIYNYISTHFYATCLVLYAWYRVNLKTLIIFVYFTMLLPCVFKKNQASKFEKTFFSLMLCIQGLKKIQASKFGRVWEEACEEKGQLWI